jgi:hypothetical protein
MAKSNVPVYKVDGYDCCPFCCCITYHRDNCYMVKFLQTYVLARPATAQADVELNAIKVIEDAINKHGVRAGIDDNTLALVRYALHIGYANGWKDNRADVDALVAAARNLCTGAQNYIRDCKCQDHTGDMDLVCKIAETTIVLSKFKEPK